jgi:signal transduction histidine kinase
MSLNSFIHFDISRKKDKIVIAISDNGGGIPDDIINRVFEPYYSTKEEGKGTGIGLYMSKVIIEKNMNGRLYCENIENGAKFIIELNRASDPQVSAE